MKHLFWAGVAATLAVSIVVCAPAQQPAGSDHAEAKPINAQLYVKYLVSQINTPDAQLRYSIREALRTMGGQAVVALQNAKQAEKNPHIKAFIDRTIARIKLQDLPRPSGNDQAARRNWMRQRFGTMDIDRLAMDAKLTLEQIAKVEPILTKARKEASDLMEVFAEAGGWRDREAWADMNEEMKAITEKVKPQLRETLNASQVERVAREVNPMARFMNRGRDRRGNRGGGFGGGRRGGGG
jgi:hypothetical protein